MRLGLCLLFHIFMFLFPHVWLNSICTLGIVIDNLSYYFQSSKVNVFLKNCPFKKICQSQVKHGMNVQIFVNKLFRSDNRQAVGEEFNGDARIYCVKLLPGTIMRTKDITQLPFIKLTFLWFFGKCLTILSCLQLEKVKQYKARLNEGSMWSMRQSSAILEQVIETEIILHCFYYPFLLPLHWCRGQSTVFFPIIPPLIAGHMGGFTEDGNWLLLNCFLGVCCESSNLVDLFANFL